jgi:hypothetical protein
MNELYAHWHNQQKMKPITKPLGCMDFFILVSHGSYRSTQIEAFPRARLSTPQF